MKLDNKSKELLENVLKEASDGKLERIKIIVDNSEVDQDVKDLFTKFVDGSEEADEVPNLTTALKAEGMKDYLESLIKETKEQALEDYKAENTNENADKDIREFITDAIVNNSEALCVPEIDMEDIEGSKKEYRKTLEDRTIEELKDLSKDLNKKIQDALSNAPEESIENETNSEDPKDSKDDEKPKSPTQQVLSSYFNE